MARYEHLPLYKKASELAIYLQNTVRHFSRYNKYSIGTELRDLSREIIRLIIRANNLEDRAETVLELVIACDIGPGKGIPIGNFTSQFFANVYLNELDQFVKHGLRCRYYLRYVDDFILIDPRGDRLPQWREGIRRFLGDRLELSLKNDGIIRRVSEGADFLGYIVRPDYILSRRRVVNNLKHKLNRFENRMVQTVRIAGISVKETDVSPETTDTVRQTLASYLGHFKHADTFRLVRSLFDRYSWLNRLFRFENSRLMLRLRYKGQFRTFRDQVAFFKSRMPDAVFLFQVGAYTEAYNDDALFLYHLTGIQLKENSRRMRYAAGFPHRHADRFAGRIIGTGRSIAWIKETGAGKYIMERNMVKLTEETEMNRG